MPVISGSATAEIEAPLERCWAVVEDVASAPEWQNGLERIDVLERDDQGRVLVCDMVSDVKLTKISSRLRFGYAGPTRMSWEQIEAGDLRSLEGYWELQPLGEERTRATYGLAVDPGPVGRLARAPLERAARAILLNPRPKELGKRLAAR